MLKGTITIHLEDILKCEWTDGVNTHNAQYFRLQTPNHGQEAENECNSLFSFYFNCLAMQALSKETKET